MTDKIIAIMQNHGLEYETIIKSTVGFRNDVYFTEKYVVKIYKDWNINGYNKELWFYNTANPSFAPKLIGFGENYIILERIYGISLFHLWRDMTDSKREQIVCKISSFIGAINSVDYNSAAQYFNIYSDWKTGMISRIENDITELKKNRGIPVSLAERAAEYTRRHTDCLDDTTLFLVFADLHFDNLLLSENGRLYLIDYEMLEIAPKDFVLDVWQRMLIHPFTYANEDDHEKTIASDYVNILKWLRKYAPDLFIHQRIKERVNIYGILYELEILRNYPMGDWPIERMEEYLKGMKW